MVKAFKKESRKTSDVNAPKAPSAAPQTAVKKKSVPGVDRPLTELDLLPLKEHTEGHQLQWPATKSSWLALAWDQFAESGEDIARHLGRQIRDLPSTKAFDKLRGRGGRLRLEVDKPVALVLGSGWGAHAMVKVVDTEAYEVACVSPRNYFLFTPILPSTAVGTVEFRSILEPIRAANPFVDYFEAVCTRVDMENKTAYCVAKHAYKDGRQPEFEIPYDVLVISVGEQPGTFGTPGVEEHCFFMKEIPDCVELRKRICDQFELAALPSTSEEDARAALHFVVVGGGPTGVEFAGTLSDFLREDLKRKYPELMQHVRVTLLNSQPRLLSAFDSRLAQTAVENFHRTGVEVRVGRVTEVTKDEIVLKGGDGVPYRMAYGVCVWSAGNAPRPLVQQLAAQIPEQAQHQPRPDRPSKLAVDPFLRVIGAKDVIAIGDCSLVVGDSMPTTAQVAGQQGAYVAHMINKGFRPGKGGLEQPPPYKPVPHGSGPGLRLFDSLGSVNSMSSTLASGEEGEVDSIQLQFYRKPFEFLNLGILAYIGNDQALTEIQGPWQKFKLSGSLAYLVWKSVYITKQVSFRNRVLILFDWLKTQVFGRDISNF